MRSKRGSTGSRLKERKRGEGGRRTIMAEAMLARRGSALHSPYPSQKQKKKHIQIHTTNVGVAALGAALADGAGVCAVSSSRPKSSGAGFDGVHVAAFKRGRRRRADRRWGASGGAPPVLERKLVGWGEQVWRVKGPSWFSRVCCGFFSEVVLLELGGFNDPAIYPQFPTERSEAKSEVAGGERVAVKECCWRRLPARHRQPGGARRVENRKRGEAKKKKETPVYTATDSPR